jgi:hypothetical protein
VWWLAERHTGANHRGRAKRGEGSRAVTKAAGGAGATSDDDWQVGVGGAGWLCVRRGCALGASQ